MTAGPAGGFVRVCGPQQKQRYLEQEYSYEQEYTSPRRDSCHIAMRLTECRHVTAEAVYRVDLLALSQSSIFIRQSDCAV